MRSWNTLDNSGIWEIKMLHDNRMTLLVQAPHEEKLKEYFTPRQGLNCNENGRIKSNKKVRIHRGRCCKMGN